MATVGEEIVQRGVAEPGALIGEMALMSPDHAAGDGGDDGADIADRDHPARLLRRVLEEYPDMAEALRHDAAARLTGMTGELSRTREALLAVDAEPASGKSASDRQAIGAITGTWSEGRSQPRASRRISIRSARGPRSDGDSHIWSSRRPRSDAAQSLAR